MAVIGHYRHHRMATIMVVIVASPERPRAQSAERSRGLLCAMFRAEREYDHEGLPRTPRGARSGLFAPSTEVV
eukprot:2722453-Alexandrium_andersonii.AAC.1